MEHEWQKELETRVARFRSKLETQKIQLDFDDLRTKHLIEVSENIRLYTTEHGHPSRRSGGRHRDPAFSRPKVALVA